jgi:purine-nucleoside/S-methyl-5'-thioadenosine phosphorylase / adenosine deaminase
MRQPYLIPEWPAPAHVRAVVTTCYSGNLATYVNDDPKIVSANRQRLQQELALPQAPVWLEQVHGVHVANLDEETAPTPADASYTQTAGRVCAILTGDCLPLLITSHRGDKVAAVHAGWRGLAAGVIDAAIGALQTPGSELLVWLGPAIGPDHFKVGDEVRDLFAARHPDYAKGFVRGGHSQWQADLYQLATLNLQHLGIPNVYGGGWCTYCDVGRFYSYRREKDQAGRMASLIWKSSGLP